MKSPNNKDLAGFRDVQNLAYRCAETVASQMTPGITERETAALMQAFLDAEGADDCFHRPFAWFGDRTAFRGFIGFKHLGGFNPAFYPGHRRLEENMPFILDCAPTCNGYTADIGYCGVIGSNPTLDKLMDDLLEYRVLILDLVRQRRTLAEVSRAVDQLCQKHGYEPRHKAEASPVSCTIRSPEHFRAPERTSARSQGGLVASVEQRCWLRAPADARSVGSGTTSGVSRYRCQVGGTAGRDRRRCFLAR